jgi:hypothetical protein
MPVYPHRPAIQTVIQNDQFVSRQSGFEARSGTETIRRAKYPLNEFPASRIQSGSAVRRRRIALPFSKPPLAFLSATLRENLFQSVEEERSHAEAQRTRRKRSTDFQREHRSAAAESSPSAERLTQMPRGRGDPFVKDRVTREAWVVQRLRPPERSFCA